MGTPSDFKTAFELLRAADPVALARTLETRPELVSARDANGKTLLIHACELATGNVSIPALSGSSEQHACVEVLLTHGADPSAAANDGWAPLHVAAMSGHVGLARRLIAAGARREGALLGARGGSALSLALLPSSTATECRRWLLDHGADPDLRRDFGGVEHGRMRRRAAPRCAIQLRELPALTARARRGSHDSRRSVRRHSSRLGRARWRTRKRRDTARRR